MSSTGSGVGLSVRRLPRLHAVTDDAVLRLEGWVDRAVQVLEAGGDDVALHLRGREVGPRILLELADVLALHAARTGAALFVNDRVDVALVADVDGVHLRGSSLPPDRARAVLGPDTWIGVSCHGPEEVDAAGNGADYVFVGSIFPTASHPGVEGLGVAGLGEAVATAEGVPLVGIGGIGPLAARPVAAAGAYGVAAIRGIWSAPNPGTAVRQYLEGLRE